jgi:hypothetical protein
MIIFARKITLIDSKIAEISYSFTIGNKTARWSVPRLILAIRNQYR